MAHRSPRSEQQTRSVDRRAVASPLSVVLRALDTKRGARTFRLKTGKCVVGSSAQADFIIDDPTVSRRHAEIELSPLGVRIRDLKSRNGTFYLASRIEDAVVAIGAHVLVGTVRIAIEPDVAEL